VAGIAPSPFAGVGANVVRAIPSYAGQPVGLKRDGARTTARPFTESVRYTIASPGRLPLNRTLFSLVDVPDLQALREQWPEAGSVWMGARPVPEVLHLALIAFARLVRAGLARSLLPLAPPISFVMDRVRWGEHRGGMFVGVTGGQADGMPLKPTWHPLVEGNDGPSIPSMAVQAAIERVLDGRAPATGARSATNELGTRDCAAVFAGRTIHPGVRDDNADPGASLYARLPGPAWNTLPAEIRQLHDMRSTTRFDGISTVTRGRTLLARLTASLFAFPRAGEGVEVTVKFKVEDGIERWTRNFAGRSFKSHQYQGQGRSARLPCERFGPLRFSLAILADSQRLDLMLRHWSAFGIPLPKRLSPWTKSFESVSAGRFQLNVEIGHRWMG
jgi:hypothetical protein